MEQLVNPTKIEAVVLDSEQMGYLKRHLGTHGACDVICRAIDELSMGLARVENNAADNDRRAVRNSCKAMKTAANLVGLKTLATVADEALEKIDTSDDVALAAIKARLVRVGQASLSALWEHPDLPF